MLGLDMRAYRNWRAIIEATMFSMWAESDGMDSSDEGLFDDTKADNKKVKPQRFHGYLDPAYSATPADGKPSTANYAIMIFDVSSNNS